jgi:hypothetical protein
MSETSATGSLSALCHFEKTDVTLIFLLEPILHKFKELNMMVRHYPAKFNLELGDAMKCTKITGRSSNNFKIH